MQALVLSVCSRRTAAVLCAWRQHCQDKAKQRQAEGQRLQAENAKLLSRLQAVDGSRDRSVQDAENRLVDVQVCPDLLTQAL